MDTIGNNQATNNFLQKLSMKKGIYPVSPIQIVFQGDQIVFQDEEKCPFTGCGWEGRIRKITIL